MLSIYILVPANSYEKSFSSFSIMNKFKPSLKQIAQKIKITKPFHGLVREWKGKPLHEILLTKVQAAEYLHLSSKLSLEWESQGITTIFMEWSDIT